MKSTQEPAPHPALLTPGTVVGSWRVVEWGGRGASGVVYRAVHVEREDEGLTSSVALKMGLLPEDLHFDREVEVLSCTRHPSIPRLRDSGVWRHPSGAAHPFIIMDWVDGGPLYEWARQHTPPASRCSIGWHSWRVRSRRCTFKVVSTGMSKGPTCWYGERTGAPCSRISARAVTPTPRC